MRQIDALRASVPFLKWYVGSRWLSRQGDPNIASFMFGNPHEMPIPRYVAALQHHLNDRRLSAPRWRASEPCRSARIGVPIERD